MHGVCKGVTERVLLSRNGASAHTSMVEQAHLAQGYACVVWGFDVHTCRVRLAWAAWQAIGICLGLLCACAADMQQGAGWLLLQVDLGLYRQFCNSGLHLEKEASCAALVPRVLLVINPLHKLHVPVSPHVKASCYCLQWQQPHLR
jgi:hypothetical protein